MFEFVNWLETVFCNAIWIKRIIYIWGCFWDLDGFNIPLRMQTITNGWRAHKNNLAHKKKHLIKADCITLKKSRDIVNFIKNENYKKSNFKMLGISYLVARHSLPLLISFCYIPSAGASLLGEWGFCVFDGKCKYMFQMFATLYCRQSNTQPYNEMKMTNLPSLFLTFAAIVLELHEKVLHQNDAIESGCQVNFPQDCYYLEILSNYYVYDLYHVWFDEISRWRVTHLHDRQNITEFVADSFDNIEFYRPSFPHSTLTWIGLKVLLDNKVYREIKPKIISYFYYRKRNGSYWQY